MEFVVKKLPTKTHRPDGMKGKFCQTFEEEIPILHKFLPENWRRNMHNLIEFCQENALVIANTLFQQHKRTLYTWTSPDGRHQNQIDYILCSQRLRSSIQSAKTRPGADCSSDYKLLIAKFRLKLKTVANHYTIQVLPKSNPLWLYSGSEK